jgi:phosphoglycerol transferase
MKNKIKILVNILIIGAIFLSTLFIIGTVYYRDSYGNIDAEQLIFTLSESLSGTGGDIFEGILTSVVIPTVIVSSLLILIFFGVHYKYFHSVRHKIVRIISLSLVGALFLSSSTYFFVGFGFFDYFKNQGSESDFIEINYVDTKNVEITFPKNKRNLILLYMESMESSFTSKQNGGCMDLDVIPELSKLAKENVNFSNNDKVGGGLSTFGTTWTTGAIAATAFGVPLKVAPNEYALDGDFLPGAYGLYDILDKAGYYMFSLKGSSISFGGMKSMLFTHADFDYIDHGKAKELGLVGEESNGFWGLEDSKVFQIAKTELQRISQKDQPFFFMMETIDTHMPDGFICDLCSNDYSDKYSNVLRCQSRQVADFVNWCKTQGWYEDTTIILLGDHLTMNNRYLQDVDEFERTIYNCFINSATDSSNVKNRRFSTVDMFPTILASIGCEIKGDKLGLGTNLFSRKKTLVELYGIKYVNNEFEKRSDFYIDNLLN